MLKENEDQSERLHNTKASKVDTVHEYAMILASDSLFQNVPGINVEAEAVLQFDEATIALQENDSDVNEVFCQVYKRASFGTCFRLHEIGYDHLNSVYNKHDFERVDNLIDILAVR